MNPWSLARARVRRIPAFLSCCFKYNISNYTTLFPDCQSLYSIFIVAIFIVYSAQRALKLEHSVPCASVVSPPVMPICSASQKRSLLYTQFTASHSTSNLFSGVLNILRNMPPLFSSYLPQHESHFSLTVCPSTTITFLQHQFSEL